MLGNWFSSNVDRHELRWWTQKWTVFSQAGRYSTIWEGHLTYMNGFLFSCLTVWTVKFESKWTKAVYFLVSLCMVHTVLKRSIKKNLKWNIINLIDLFQILLWIESIFKFLSGYSIYVKMDIYPDFTSIKIIQS